MTNLQKKNRKNKNEKRARRIARVRAKFFGTKEKPRLAVFRSNRHIYAHIVDDSAGATVASAHDLKKTGNKRERAESVGGLIAEAAKSVGVSRVVFDRRGYKYHGRIKLLAEKARASGLEF